MLLYVCVLHDFLLTPVTRIYCTVPGHWTVERTVYKIAADRKLQKYGNVKVP